MEYNDSTPGLCFLAAVPFVRGFAGLLEAELAAAGASAAAPAGGQLRSGLLDEGPQLQRSAQQAVVRALEGQDGHAHGRLIWQDHRHRHLQGPTTMMTTD